MPGSVISAGILKKVAASYLTVPSLGFISKLLFFSRSMLKRADLTLRLFLEMKRRPWAKVFCVLSCWKT